MGKFNKFEKQNLLKQILFADLAEVTPDRIIFRNSNQRR